MPNTREQTLKNKGLLPSVSSHCLPFRHRLKYVQYKIKTYLPRVFPAAILVKN